MDKVLLVTPERCIGCGSCELACSFNKSGQFKPSVSRVGVHRFEKGQNVPMMCFQCDEAPCAKACKPQALHKGTSGLVEFDKDKCIGCRMCVMACPFGNVSYDRSAKELVKCDQCGGDPQCVQFCPTKAIEYLPAESAVLNKKRRFAKRISDALEEVKD
ncbi:4Fe-4S ferredoxin iron-sulfur binding domain protein [Thermanaerovibrio acidaminovorans DSM 6589]|uniref:4Fe-4S ferredoxin iron-sulfur binding domain protein n=1 Tax=Thermanaerovibrio acidaminovorans (strain ATCC 49978 / DSM 6589 / Su883) TaxID=525903 RepID=D1B8V6_THEAS|nr:4Fe-4S dicluster domain-containing protein [Thermanaerovibrio acidaminovorans]ACZ18709.1 4Fe-4S ferredoxin iron-sulfur binding domain protein [Thermanaerovibrio acidaminovorans DSM 6589]